MKTLIKLALILIVGVLVYNYFLGTEEEKATSEKVFEQVKDVGKSIGELLKAEKEKFADGKYDDTFERLGLSYEKLKEKLSSKEDKDKLDELEERKDELMREKESIEKALEANEMEEDLPKRQDKLNEELKTLWDQTKDLLRKIGEKEE